MNLKEATQLAQQEANETGEMQAVVRLREDWEGGAVYTAIESRWANGLRGIVVSEIEPEEK